MQAKVLKFHIWIPHEKVTDIFFFAYQDYAPFGLWPFEKMCMESCQQNISKTIEARALTFED